MVLSTAGFGPGPDHYHRNKVEFIVIRATGSGLNRIEEEVAKLTSRQTKLEFEERGYYHIIPIRGKLHILQRYFSFDASSKTKG